MQLSYWEQESIFNNVDVVVIGSGIVGLNAALNLKIKNTKLKIVILERGVLPYGASTRNAGVACFGSVSELLDDLTRHSEEEVFSLVVKRWNGLKRLRENLGDATINYEPFGGYELFSENENELYEKCSEKLGYFNKHLSEIIGTYSIYKSVDSKIEKFGFKGIKYLIENVAEGQLDTGKMMLALLKKVRALDVIVLNGMNVKSFNDTATGVEIICENGIEIKAARMLIATNGFAKGLVPELDVFPARAQVLITSPIKNLKIKGSFHFDKGYYYFRNVGDRLLFGGGRNLDFKTEETTEFGLTELVQNRLEELLKNVILPNTKYEIDQRWSGIMGLGNKKTIIMKPVSENVFCAVRMGGMGVAIGSLVGEDAAEMIINLL